MLCSSLCCSGGARRGLVVLGLLSLVACGPSVAQGSAPGSSLVRTSAAVHRDQPAADGRKPSGVMSVEGAGWLDRSDRATNEEPDRVIGALAIQPGSFVADVGAGTGYFSLRLAKQVGPTGRVLATDIQQPMLDQLQANAQKAGLSNLTYALTTDKDAKLPVGELDLVLMVDVFHELEKPALTLTQVRRALRPDGRLVLIEYRGEDPAVAVKDSHKMTLEQIKREVIPVGFRLDVVHEFLRDQRVVVFRPAL